MIVESKRAKIWEKSGDKDSHHDHNASRRQEIKRVMVWGAHWSSNWYFDTGEMSQ